MGLTRWDFEGLDAGVTVALEDKEKSELEALIHTHRLSDKEVQQRTPAPIGEKRGTTLKSFHKYSVILLLCK